MLNYRKNVFNGKSVLRVSCGGINPDIVFFCVDKHVQSDTFLKCLLGPIAVGYRRRLLGERSAVNLKQRAAV